MFYIGCTRFFKFSIFGVDGGLGMGGKVQKKIQLLSFCKKLNSFLFINLKQSYAVM